jgi:hypothetical protein
MTMGMANLEFKTPSELLDDIVRLRKALEQRDRHISDVAREITVQIMKERSRSAGKPRTLEQWESYIKTALTGAFQ